MEVIRCGDDDGIDLIELEQILEVSEHVGDLQPLGDRARLGTVVVTERDELGAFELRQHGEVRELCDRTGAHEADADGILRLQFLVANRRFGQSSSPDNRSLISYDNSAPRARDRWRPTGTCRFRGRNHGRSR
jgi:hypothetical protein